MPTPLATPTRALARSVTRRALVAALALCAGCPSNPAQDAAPPVVRDVPDLGDYNVPAGFTLTPFFTAEPVRSFSSADAGVEPGRDYRAVLDTDAGRIVLDLLESDAPVTVNSFVWLARHHYFDLLQFHRVLEGFIAQGGDPFSADEDARPLWGTGGPGYSFGLEIAPALRFDMAGVVGMSRGADPNTNGSQFFITLGPAPAALPDASACGATLAEPRTALDGCYTVFARVVDDGDGSLTRFAYGQPPRLPTRMLRVFVIERPM